MEFKLQYLQALRQQAPKLFNQLNREGKLQEMATEKAAKAERAVRGADEGAPKEQGGYPKEPFASQAMQQVTRC